MESKRCCTCKRTKKIRCFNLDKKTEDGHCGRCKDCDKAYRVKNREGILEVQKKWREKNKEKRSVLNKRRYKDNRKKILIQHKKWYEGNKKKVLMQHKKWREENREKIKKYQTEIKRQFGGLYGVWGGMKRRCYNPNREAYKRYGGRGITVCPEWQSFSGFYEWAKEKHKPGLQIDRRNNDGNYCPENCRFVTPAENRRNASTVRLNAEKVEAIRELLKIGGLTQKTIGAKFDVSEDTVRNIKTKKTWR